MALPLAGSVPVLGGDTVVAGEPSRMGSMETVTTTLPHLTFSVLASGSTAGKQLLAARS